MQNCVYKDLIISTIVDEPLTTHAEVVYKDLIISTIVDTLATWTHQEMVYKDLIISTIVDFDNLDDDETKSIRT